MRMLVAFAVLLISMFCLNKAGNAAVSINVDLSSQSMQVASGDGQSYSWPISSARAGFSTPRGNYKPQRLEKMHYSRKYHNSPMPHSIFFRGGYAIHGTGAIGQLGRPASHGCIRLSPGHAAQLFAMVKAEGARIQISGTPPGSTRFASTGHKKHHKVYASRHHKSKAYASSRHHRGKSYAGNNRHKRIYYANNNQRRNAALGYAAPPLKRYAPVKTWQTSPANWFSR